LIKDRTLAMADKPSNNEVETLFKLLLPEERGEEKTEFAAEDKEEGSVVDKLGTDTLLGFEEIVLGDVPVVALLTVGTSLPGCRSEPRPLLFVPSQAMCTTINSLIQTLSQSIAISNWNFLESYNSH
jgi:hypothetical protein